MIEGTDGSGKSVQAAMLKNYLSKNGFHTDPSGVKGRQVSLLEDYLTDKGFTVKTDDYPRYETSVWGKLIGRMLTGEMGNPNEISPYLTVLPYMLDEYFGSKDISKWLKAGYFVISNRYFTSNVHQVAKLKGEEQKKFREWLWVTGFDVLGIVKPDLVFFLDVIPEVARELIKKKLARNYTGGQLMDKVESDMDHQARSREEYILMCQNHANWVRVECCEEGKMLPTEIIGQKVVEVLLQREII